MSQSSSLKFDKIHIEISNVCNLQCSFCPEVVRAKKIMDLELFGKILEQVAPLTDQIALHLMGEPLLHPKLHEMVSLSESHRLRINLVSNGVLLKGDRPDLLLHPVFRQVNFSLHSYHDNFGDQDPSAYLEAIFAYTEKAFVVRPDLYINYRLWNLANPKGATQRNRDTLSRIAKRFLVSVPDEVNLHTKKSFRLLNRLYLHFDTEFIWPDMDLPVLGTRGTCYGLRSHFGILADGTVVPCCLDKEAFIPLGNVQTSSLPEILGSPRAKNILKGFRERRLVEDLCQRCQYIERFSATQTTRS